MNIEKLFFQLLQVAVGTRKTLDKQPTSREWALLFGMSKKQSLVAIAMAGVTKLNRASDYGASLGIPEVLYLKWLGLTAKVAQRNKAVSSACVKLCEEYIHDGLRCCVLKGQSNLQYYPEELREYRTPGDIDVWALPQGKPPSIPLHRGKKEADCEAGVPIAVSDLDGKGAHYEYYTGIRGTIEYVMMQWRMKGGEPEEIRYHHIDAPEVDGVSVETHFRPMYMSSPWRNRRLQRWFDGKADQELKSCIIKGGASAEQGRSNPLMSHVPSPSVGFDAVYQLTHIYRHLFSEGIGLRQLLDYYFVLRALHVEQGELADRGQSIGQWAEDMGLSVPSNTEIMHTLGRFGMKRFAGAVMWVLREVFAMPSVYMICAPNEDAGRFLLDEIMMSGNFGKYDERNRQMQGASKLKRFWLLSKRNWRFLTQYPSEVLWDPYRRAYNVMWRKLELWRF